METSAFPLRDLPLGREEAWGAEKVERTPVFLPEHVMQALASMPIRGEMLQTLDLFGAFLSPAHMSTNGPEDKHKAGHPHGRRGVFRRGGEREREVGAETLLALSSLSHRAASLKGVLVCAEAPFCTTNDMSERDRLEPPCREQSEQPTEEI